MRTLSHFLHTFWGYLGRLGALLIAPLVAGSVFVPAAANAQDYEIWAIDQGTNIVHIYNTKLEEVGRIDMGAHEVRVPHMIHFTSDYAYAFIASTASGDVSVIRTADRVLVSLLKTGPATHRTIAPPSST